MENCRGKHRGSADYNRLSVTPTAPGGRKLGVYASPVIHGFPWCVPDTIANKHVLLALKKQAFRRYKGSEGALTSALQALQDSARNSEWQAAALQQTTKMVWAHQHELTAYQVWVTYRVAVRQLNLYHPGRENDDSCRKLHCCSGVKQTTDHIFWTCPCAQVCWQKLICHWTGERWGLGQLQYFLVNGASRRAPALSKVVLEQLTRHHPDEVDAYAAVWERIWHILSSSGICITSLWIQRNRGTFQEADVTIAVSVYNFGKPA